MDRGGWVVFTPIGYTISRRYAAELFGCSFALGEYVHLQPLRRGRRASLPRRRCARRALAMAWWARGGAAWYDRPPRRSFSSEVPHRPDQPAPPSSPIMSRTGPHGVRRVVLAGREARADPGEAPTRARRPRRLSEGSGPRVLATRTRRRPLGAGRGGVVRGCSGAHPHRATRGTPPQLPMCGSRALILRGTGFDSASGPIPGCCGKCATLLHWGGEFRDVVVR